MFRVTLFFFNQAKATRTSVSVYQTAANLLQLSPDVVEFVHNASVKEGATIPFLARYRRDRTHGLDDVRLQRVLDVTQELFVVEKRRRAMIKKLDESKRLTPALEEHFNAITTVDALNDAWEPFKTTRVTQAQRARNAGLDALITRILGSSEPCDISLLDSISDGKTLAVALLTQRFAQVPRARTVLIKALLTQGVMTCLPKRLRKDRGEPAAPAAGGEVGAQGDHEGDIDDDSGTGGVVEPHRPTAAPVSQRKFGNKPFGTHGGLGDDGHAFWSRRFQSSFHRRYRLATMRSSQFLSALRGESHGVLRLSFEFPPTAEGAFREELRLAFPKAREGLFFDALKRHRRAVSSTVSECDRLVYDAIRKAFDKLTKSAILSVRRELARESIYESSIVFSQCVKQLLLQPPRAHGLRILAMDPGFTHGTKCVVLGQDGGVLGKFLIKAEGARRDGIDHRLSLDSVAAPGGILEEKLLKVYHTLGVRDVVIGNGVASREVEEAVAAVVERNQLRDMRFSIGSEVGASVYSVSPLARQEFPNVDVMFLGAISIGRRLQDPLAELIKVPVRALGVGQYQHDVDEALLERELTRAVQHCVSARGIEMETTTSNVQLLLSKLPGVSSYDAMNIAEARRRGELRNREDLRKIVEPPVFQQIAGFIRFRRAPAVLDETIVHPESYRLVADMLRALGLSEELLTRQDDTAVQICKEKSLNSALTLPRNRAALPLLSPSPSLEALRLCLLERLEVVRKRRSVPPSLAKSVGCSPAAVHTLLDQLLPLPDEGLLPAASLPPHDAGLSTVETEQRLFQNNPRHIADATIGTLVNGVVRSVTMFGAFVDIGMVEATMLIYDPDFRFRVGDILRNVRICQIDVLAAQVRGDVADLQLRPSFFPPELVDIDAFRARRAANTLVGDELFYSGLSSGMAGAAATADALVL